jgi:sarcosine oxidase, subunit beta
MAVIGGGSTGTSIAFYLQKKGAGKVALIEKDEIAWGQTGKSTAVVRMHYSTEELVKLASASYPILKDMEAKVGGPSGFIECGVVVAGGEQDAAAINANVKMQKGLGVDTSLITARDLSEIEPHIQTDGIAAAAYEPHSGFADPVATAKSFADAFVREGGMVQTRTLVKGFRLNGNRITAIVTDNNTIEADTVINASGVWANDLLSSLNISLPIDVIHEYVVLIKRPQSFQGSHIVFMDVPNNYYIVPKSTSQTCVSVLTGDMSRRERSPSSYDDVQSGPDFETMNDFAEKLAYRFPTMREAEALGGWSGLEDVTPDWHPIFDWSSTLENLFNAVGLSGHGFKICPALGMFASDLILRRKSNLIDHHFFAEDRFSVGRTISARLNAGSMA